MPAHTRAKNVPSMSPSTSRRANGRRSKAAQRRPESSLSQHARELCLRRSVAAQIVAGTRRNPDARALINELMAIGNNVNQLTRHCNTERTAPQLLELKMTTDMLKAALAHVLAL